MNIETVNELITSLESAGELSIKERKYLELAKSYVQLALDNLALKQIVDSVTDLSNEPQYHAEGIGCGLEDRGITDLYDACRYGWDEAMERVYGGVIPCAEELDFSATDRIYAGIKASTIPEGFKLVPEQMYLSVEDIQAICMQCGNGDKKGYGDYEDGILWVGELSNDGEMKYGLNIANANYPEEGSITVFEFDEPLREGAK